VIAATERPEPKAIASSNSCRALILDPDLRSLVESVCEEHQWGARVIGERWDTVLPEQSRPKLLLLGFAAGDANSLEFLDDLYRAYPDISVAAVTGDSLVHVGIVVSQGERRVVVTPTGATQSRQFPASAEDVGRRTWTE
jgi:hypothetical protein